MPGASLTQFNVLDGREPIDTRPFELYLALQEFFALKQHLSVIEKPLGMHDFHLWFEPFIQRWISVSKAKALQVIRAISVQKIQFNFFKKIPHRESDVPYRWTKFVRAKK